MKIENVISNRLVVLVFAAILIILSFVIKPTTSNAASSMQSNVTGNVYSNSLIQAPYIQGTITDANGAPIPNIKIEAFTYFFAATIETLGTATTDQNGHFVLNKSYNDREGFLGLRFTINGYFIIKSVSDDQDTFNFQFPKELSVETGKITLDNGVPVPGIPVYYDVRLSTAAYYTICTATTDESGNYSIPYVDSDYGWMKDVTTDPTHDIQNVNTLTIKAPPDTLYGYIVGIPYSDVTLEIEGVGSTKPLENGGFAIFNVNDNVNELKISSTKFSRPLLIDVNVDDKQYINVFSYDKPPVVEAHIDRLPDENGWYNHDGFVSFTATDDDFAPLQYISGPQGPYSEGVNQVISGYADDTIGNRGEASITVNFDKTPPITTIAQGVPNFSNTNIAVNLVASDNVSGVTETEYQVNGEAWNKYNRTITFSKEGINTINYRSTDKAGNVEAIQTATFTIDKTAPVTLYHLDPLYDKTAQGKTGSGIKSIQYRFNGGAWIRYTSPLIILAGETHTVEYFSTDNAGNTESPINKMDFDKGIFTGAGKY
jgi:hypothetical protein